MLAFEFTFVHVCPQVVVLDEYGIAQVFLDIKKEIPLKQSKMN